MFFYYVRIVLFIIRVFIVGEGEIVSLVIVRRVSKEYNKEEKGKIIKNR